MTSHNYSSAIEKPIAVSISNSLSNRVEDLLAIKDNISQGSSRLKTTLNGLNTIDQTLDQLKAVARQHAATDDVANRRSLRASSILAEVNWTILPATHPTAAPI